METRVCTNCKEEKLLSEYYFRKKENRYSTICKTCMKERSKKYRESHKEYYRNYMKKYRYENIEYYRNYLKNNSYKYNNKDYYDLHKDERREYQRCYYRKNKDTIYKYAKEYRKKLKNNSSLYKIKIKISSLLRKVFVKQGDFHNNDLPNITRLDNKCLYDYLLKTFKNNYGFDYDGRDVHIDHIKPLATAKTVDDVYVLNHYTNLQLLTPEDNMHKWKH